MRKVLALAIWLALAPMPARAFVCLHADPNNPNSACLHWTQGQATMNSFLPGGWDQNSVTAGNDWNGVGAAFHFTVNAGGQFNEPCGSPGPGHACSNTGPVGSNPIVFRSDFCGQSFGSDIIELTNNCWDPNSGAMLNAPVFVNSNAPWGAYDGPLQPPLNDIRRVLLHEFGHVLGLDHPDIPSTHGIPAQHVVAIMNHIESNLDSLQSDDIGGILSIYPSDTSTGAPSASAAPMNSCHIDTRASAGSWLIVLPPLALLLWRRR